MAEKPTAETLNGDPQHLIRVMPAKGDRPADHFVAGLRHAILSYLAGSGTAPQGAG
jgi:hypothetical protein